MTELCSADRLVLGTAAFGLDYGTTNEGGQVSGDEVARILALAGDRGIGAIDTAPAYGAAEAVLGAQAGVADFAIVTKSVPSAGAGQEATAERLLAGLRDSLARLGRDSVAAFLIHHGADLVGPDGAELLRGLHAARDQGLAVRIGVSVYDGAELDAVLRCFRPEVVQLPLNLFDQRLLASGHLARLADLGVEVHVRSVFLQGVLIAPPERRPAWTGRWSDVFRRLDEAIEVMDVGRLALCLGLPMARPEVSRIVVGVAGCDELAEILRAAEAPARDVDWARFAVDDPKLIDPRRWSAAA